MTLRSRLLLALVGFVALGLVLSDVITYSQLRSFLVARIDPQLEVASYSMAMALDAQNGLGPPLPFVSGPNRSQDPNQHAGAIVYPLPGSVAQKKPSFPGGQANSGLEPAGTYGALLGANERVFGDSSRWCTPARLFPPRNSRPPYQRPQPTERPSSMLRALLVVTECWCVRFITTT